MDWGGATLVLLLVDVVYDIGVYNILYALLFFSIGGYIAFHGRELTDRKYNNTIVVISATIWILSIVLSVIEPMMSYGKLEIIVQLLLIISFWILLSLIQIDENSRVLKLAKMSFFVYCAHGILLEGLEKIWYIVAGDRPIAALVDFCVMPIAVIVSVIGVGILLKKSCPPVWRVLNGGR